MYFFVSPWYCHGMTASFVFYGLITVKLIMAIGVAVVYLRFFNTTAGLKQMTPLDIIVNFLLSAILSDFILDRHIGILDFVVVVIIYGFLLYVLNRLTFNTDLGRRIFIGSPRVIIQHGRIDEEAMARLHISAHDLALAKIHRSPAWLKKELRKKKIRDIDEILIAQWHNGRLQIVKKN